MKTTQELMRHAKADITLELYAQAVTDDKREAQSVLAALIRWAKNPGDAEEQKRAFPPN